MAITFGIVAIIAIVFILLYIVNLTLNCIINPRFLL